MLALHALVPIGIFQKKKNLRLVTRAATTPGFAADDGVTYKLNTWEPHVRAQGGIIAGERKTKTKNQNQAGFRFRFRFRFSFTPKVRSWLIYRNKDY